MADEQKPEGSAAPPPPGARPPAPPKNRCGAPKPASQARRGSPRRASQAPRRHGHHALGSDITQFLKERFGGDITEFSTYLGQNFLVAKPDAVIPILETLKLELDFDYLVDVTAVDYPKRAERFDVVYILI
jgi:hypothetical protein